MSHRGAPDRDDVTWVWLLWSELPAGKDRPGRRPTGRIAGPSRHLLLGCRVPGGAWDRPGVTLGRLGPARCGIGPVTARSVGRRSLHRSHTLVTSPWLPTRRDAD